MSAHTPWFKLHVEEFGGFQFRVQSEEGHGTYMVDALENDGAGRCDCPHFRGKLAQYHGPDAKAHPLNDPNFTSICKHIMRVNQFMADRLKQNALKEPQYRGP